MKYSIRRNTMQMQKSPQSVEKIDRHINQHENLKNAVTGILEALGRCGWRVDREVASAGMELKRVLREEETNGRERSGD
jgi:hypothetical protein